MNIGQRTRKEKHHPLKQLNNREEKADVDHNHENADWTMNISQQQLHNRTSYLKSKPQSLVQTHFPKHEHKMYMSGTGPSSQNYLQQRMLPGILTNKLS